jgi:GNAT superfamily N-acetyltransferase
MGELDIRAFTPDDRDDVRACLAVLNAASAVDSPWQQPVLLRGYDGMLRHGWDGEPETPYLAVVDGRPVGAGAVSLTERDNRHLAWLTVVVDPPCRRLGFGTLMFGRLVEAARTAGRTSVGADGWDAPGTIAFAASVGLETRSKAIQRRQHLAELGPTLARDRYHEAAARAGDYELVRIAGRTPPELLGPLSELTAAINDAPTDDLDVEDEVFSPERLAAFEESTLARGLRLYRVVARHKGTGALAGHTALTVEIDRPALAEQQDTAVARAHRGHRLGLLLKAAMLLWLEDVEPQVRTVDTWNAESNEHMIAVNQALGYRVMGRALQFQMAV